MLDARKLYILTELRSARGITLEQMALACGLRGTRSRESVAAWERGQSIPHIRKRPKIIEYLANTLALRDDPAQFQTVWDIFVEEWDWELLSTSEWQYAVLDTRTIGLAKHPIIPLSSQPSMAPKSWTRTEWPAVTTTHPNPAALPPGSRMPFSHNPLFVGRSGDLTALAAALKREPSASSMTVVIAATGMGGIGKTQLATEFVHRYGQFFAGGVFWLSFANPNAVQAEIATCGGEGHLALRSNYESLSLDDQVRLVLEEWSNPLPRLLIFDNCEDPALLERWLPKQGGSRVLLTSRRAQWSTDLAVQTLLLGVLSRRESIELLQNHCPDLGLDDIDLTAIAAELEDLPLALHLAGRFLALYRANVAPGTYVHQLRGPSILSHPSLRSSGNSPTGHDQHVGRTFAFSYERLNTAIPIDRAARALLARAARFAPGEPIPRDLLLATLNLTAGDPTMLAADALARSIDLGLIEVAGLAGEFVRMHRLIAAFVRQLDNDPQAQSDVEQLLLATAKHLNAIGAQMQLLALQSHLRAATDIAHIHQDEHTAALCYELSQHLFQIEDYDGALHYNQRSLNIRTAHLGEHDPGIAPNLHHMGWILDWQALDAKPYHERALAIRKAALGDEHPDTAESFNYMGTILHARCEYISAQYYYEQALMTRERVLGEEHPETAQSLNNLGLLMHAQGHYKESYHYHQRALTIREALSVPNYAQLAITLNNLGYLLRAMGHYTEACKYLERALLLREQVFGSGNTYIAVTLNHLGRLHHYRGDYHQASLYLERALTIRKQAFRPSHPDIANNFGNLGMVLYDQGDYAGATSYLKRALAMHEQVWSENHRHTARSLNHVGLLLHAQGNLFGARSHLERALKIRKELLGSNHPDTANSLGNLGMVLLAQGDIALAQHDLEQALVSHQQRLGDEHPYTARSLDRMGCFLHIQRNDKAARVVLEQALAIYQHRLGADHPYTTICLNHLTELSSDIGD